MELALLTIRAKFAAVLLLGICLTIIALSFASPSQREGLLQASRPIMIVGPIIALVIMLLIERVVIAPIGRLTRDVVAIAAGETSSYGRLPVEGSGELATLAKTFNRLIDTLEAKQRLEAQLVHMAHHDGLTSLPNRVLFREKLQLELARVRRGEKLAVLCLDLDQFKSVNDTLGHPVGDALLQAVADRMRDCVREVDTVARLGGDEFAIIQVGLSEPDAAIVVAERLIRAMSEPFDISGHHVVIGTSIGIAFAPDDAEDSELIIKSADLALYRAKTDGRGVFRFFEPEMDARMQARRILELDLRRALIQCEFELYYQPLVNLQSNKVSGFEALLRWNHPEHGLIPPSSFIPIAEEIGLIVPIGEWVVGRACAEAATWPEELKVAVNLSPAQFKSKGLVLAVTSALARSGLGPHRLELEITETVLLLESEATLATLHQLRELGVKISMDDFGTGYSSLSYLRSFPFDKIKIDRSFVQDVAEQSSGSQAIVKAVSGLGKNLGMTTTAEGVETAEQLSWLRLEGCSEVQGYLFSRPMPASDVRSMITRVNEQGGSATEAPAGSRKIEERAA